MKKILIAVAVIVLGALTASAQQVSPVIQETKMKHSVKGQFTVTNNGLSNMPVVVEPMEVVGSKTGAPNFIPLSPDVKVELKDTSAIVGPKGQRTFDFKISSERTVAVAFFNSMMTGARTKDGIVIRFIIPAVVYACVDSEKDCRTRTKAALGITE